MKLATAISPRKDGTVTLTGLDGKPYVFTLDETTGEMVCDIEHEGTLAHLLALSDFYPLDEADYAQANALVADLSGELDDSKDEGESDPDDLDVDPDALPVEANTPPKPGAPRKIKK